MSRALDAAIDAILIALVFFTPLAFGSVHVWAYTLMELSVFCLFVLWTVKYLFPLKGKEPVPPFEKGHIPVYASLLLFLLIVVLQLIPLGPSVIGAVSPGAFRLYEMLIPEYGRRSLSIDPHETMTALIKFAAPAVVFFVISSGVRGRRRIERLAAALILSGFIEALLGLYGYFSRDSSVFGVRKIYGLNAATGTFVNRNHFAGYLGIAVFTGIGLLIGRLSGRPSGRYGLKQRVVNFLSTSRLPFQAALLVMTVTMALGIFFSFSRSAVASLLAALTLLMAISLLSGQKKTPGALVVISSLMLAAGLFYGMIEPLEERFRNSGEQLYISRVSVWKDTLRVIGDFPLVGTGLGTYEDSFQLYAGTGRLIIPHAHNDYLELLSDVGIAGALPLFFCGIYFLLHILRKRRACSTFPRGMSLGGAGALIYISLHSLTDFNIHIPANALAVSIAAALAFASLPAGTAAGQEPVTLRRVLSAALSISIAAYLGLFAINEWRAERAFPVERSFVRGDPPSGVIGATAVEGLRSAIELSPDNYRYHVLLGKFYAYGMPHAGLKDSLRKAGEEYRRANSLNPFFTETLSYLAWVDFSLGRPSAGLSRLEAALRADPNNYFNHLYYGICISIFLDSLPEDLRWVYIYRAEEEFKRGIALNPSMASHPSVFANRAALCLRKGDISGAVRELENAGPMGTATLPYHLRLAELYLKSGKQGKGLDRYRRLLGMTGLEAKDRDKITASLKKEAAWRPTDAGLKFLLGKALLDGNNFGEALESLNEALALRPGWAEAHYLMGEAYEAIGEKDKAYDSYIATLRFSKNHPGASRKILDFHGSK